MKKWLALGLVAMLVVATSLLSAPPISVSIPANEKMVKQEMEPTDTFIPPKTVMGEATRLAAKGIPFNYQMMNVEKAWTRKNPLTGKGIKFGVLDTGIDAKHPDIVKNLKDFKDFTGSRTGGWDVSNHGTWCWGVVGANGDFKGIAYDATGYSAKVLSDSERGQSDWLLAGTRWLIDECDVDVITCSIGANGGDRWLKEAVAYAKSKDVPFFAASGNDGPNENTIDWPGAYEETYAISSVNRNRQVSNFSSRGANVWATCVGENVVSTVPGGQYAASTGTSMSTPQFAAYACLLLQERKETGSKLSRREYVEANMVPTLSLANRRNTAAGFGFPDFSKIADRAESPSPAPAPSPDTIVIDIDDLVKKGYKRLEIKK